MPNFTAYVICTSPRSGSTLLCKLLAATGQSGNPSSLFHKPSISAWLEDYRLSESGFSDERETLKAIFRAAWTQGVGATGILGVRLQRHSFPYFTEKLKILHLGISGDIERFQAAFGEMLFIHLTRDNKLEQAISLVKAKQTGLWHMRPDGTELERVSEPRDPFYDAEEIARNLAELTAFDKQWEASFKFECVEPLRVSYAELSAKPNGVLAGALDRLGLDQSVAHAKSPPVAKLADATSQEWAERFLQENLIVSYPS